MTAISRRPHRIFYTAYNDRYNFTQKVNAMTREQKIGFAKMLLRTIVGTSTASVVSTVIQNNVESDKKKDKVQAYIAGVSVGAVVADKTRDWSDKMVDDIVGIFDKKTEENAEDN